MSRLPYHPKRLFIVDSLVGILRPHRLSAESEGSLRSSIEEVVNGGIGKLGEAIGEARVQHVNPLLVVWFCALTEIIEQRQRGLYASPEQFSRDTLEFFEAEILRQAENHRPDNGILEEIRAAFPDDLSQDLIFYLKTISSILREQGWAGVEHNKDIQAAWERLKSHGDGKKPMRAILIPSWITVTVCVMHFLAVADLPYAYYQYLRIVTFLWAGLAACILIGRGHKIGWVAAVVALVFNPLAPIEMSREAWRLPNISVFIFGLIVRKTLSGSFGVFFLRDKRGENGTPSPTAQADKSSTAKSQGQEGFNVAPTPTGEKVMLASLCAFMLIFIAAVILTPSDNRKVRQSPESLPPAHLDSSSSTQTTSSASSTRHSSGILNSTSNNAAVNSSPPSSKIFLTTEALTFKDPEGKAWQIPENTRLKVEGNREEGFTTVVALPGGGRIRIAVNESSLEIFSPGMRKEKGENPPALSGLKNSSPPNLTSQGEAVKTLSTTIAPKKRIGMEERCLSGEPLINIQNTISCLIQHKNTTIRAMNSDRVQAESRMTRQEKVLLSSLIRLLDRGGDAECLLLLNTHYLEPREVELTRAICEAAKADNSASLVGIFDPLLLPPFLDTKRLPIFCPTQDPSYYRLCIDQKIRETEREWKIAADVFVETVEIVNPAAGLIARDVINVQESVSDTVCEISASIFQRKSISKDRDFFKECKIPQTQMSIRMIDDLSQEVREWQ